MIRSVVLKHINHIFQIYINNDMYMNQIYLVYLTVYHIRSITMISGQDYMNFYSNIGGTLNYVDIKDLC
jgi:hypothetical protein